MKYLLVFVLLLFSIDSFASDLALEHVEGCDVNDDESMTETGWSTMVSDISKECLFSTVDKDMKSKPVIKIEGTIIDLVLILREKATGKWQDHEMYESKDGSVRLELYSRLERDSCINNDGGCCGQNHEGRLIVSKQGVSREYHVEQWHGM